MLILVSVSISIALNTGLFSKAGEAVGDMNNAKTREQGLASGGVEIGGEAYNSIDEYLATNPGGTTVTPTLTYPTEAYDDVIKDGNGCLTANATYTTTATSKYSTDYGATWTTGSYTKSASGKVLLTTGASENFKSKNIYDVAGNVWEWTTEATSSNDRHNRGGDYYDDGSNFSASSRYFYSYFGSSTDSLGFRPALYIK